MLRSRKIPTQVINSCTQIVSNEYNEVHVFDTNLLLNHHKASINEIYNVQCCNICDKKININTNMSNLSSNENIDYPSSEGDNKIANEVVNSGQNSIDTNLDPRNLIILN